jgi:hypothetical protein
LPVSPDGCGAGSPVPPLPGGEMMNVETEYTTSVPHGGTLVNRRAPEDEREERRQRAQELPKQTIPLFNYIMA